MVDEFAKHAGWDCNEVVPCDCDLQKVIFERRNSYIFIDEASDIIGHQPDRQDILKKARHWGHFVFVIAQRANQIHPSTRTQCTMQFIFWQSRIDGEILSREFGADEYANALTLPQGVCYWRASSYSPVKKINVFA